MLISGRQAAARLEAVGLARRQARQVLGAGLAGDPCRTAGALLYRSELVEALTRWPRLHPGQLDESCPRGAFVARAGRRVLDVRTSREAQVATFSEGWRLGIGAWLWLMFHVRVEDPFPFLVTVAGFVAMGADITATQYLGRGSVALTLEPPGEWYEHARDRRLRTGPGQEWMIRGLDGSSWEIPRQPARADGWPRG